MTSPHWRGVGGLLLCGLVVVGCADPSDRVSPSTTQQVSGTQRALAIHEAAVRECSVPIESHYPDPDVLSFENWTDGGAIAGGANDVRRQWVYTVDVTDRLNATVRQFSCRLSEHMDGTLSAALVDR